MEIVLSLAIGVLSASGIWLILRPRSFQVIVGLCLLSYAVNLFIFSMGRLTLSAPGARIGAVQAISDEQRRARAWHRHALGATVGTVEEAVAAHLHASVMSLTQNAVRGIPLGQDAGQRVVRRAQEWVLRAVEVSRGLHPDDLGAIAPGLEIAQMRHERQRARMFMS